LSKDEDREKGSRR